MVELVHERADRRVGLLESEEADVAQRGQDRLLHCQNVPFHLGFIFWPANPGRDDRHAVMAGELGVRRVDLGVVVVGAGHSALEVVGSDHPRDASKKLEGAGLRPCEVFEVLGPRNPGVRVPARPQRGDEDLRFAHLSGGPFDDRHRHAGVVHEHTLAGGMDLAHRHVKLPDDFPVMRAELGVTQRIGMLLSMLLPQQPQRHPASPQLPMDVGPIRLRTCQLDLSRIQHMLQLGVAELRRQRPR